MKMSRSHVRGPFSISLTRPRLFSMACETKRPQGGVAWGLGFAADDQQARRAVAAWLGVFPTLVV